MGTGRAVKEEGICRDVILTHQYIKIVEGFLPLDLGGTDVILGMWWLESHRGMHMNWKLLTIQFQVEGVTVTLQGDPSLSTSSVSLKAMWKALREQGKGVLVELYSIGLVEHPPEPNVSTPIQKIVY